MRFGSGPSQIIHHLNLECCLHDKLCSMTVVPGALMPETSRSSLEHTVAAGVQ